MTSEACSVGDKLNKLFQIPSGCCPVSSFQGIASKFTSLLHFLCRVGEMRTIWINHIWSFWPNHSWAIAWQLSKNHFKLFQIWFTPNFSNSVFYKVLLCFSYSVPTNKLSPSADDTRDRLFRTWSDWDKLKLLRYSASECYGGTFTFTTSFTHIFITFTLLTFTHIYYFSFYLINWLSLLN